MQTIRKLYFAVLLLTAAVCMYGMPRLTVVIAVDGLRSDNMEYMRNLWLPGGLRTLQDDAVETQVKYDFNVQGDNETLATLLTGVQPSEHGLSHNQYFDRKEKQVRSFFEDKSEQGIGTKEQVSLRRMAVATLSDRYRLRYDKYTKIYAVGLQAGPTLLLAGHNANGFCWLDKKTRKWVTSTYCGAGLPAAADAENMSEQKSDNRNAPKINSMVVDMALRLQEQEQMGMDDTPDLLLLQMSVVSSLATDRIQGKKDEDIHQGLNQYLGFLIEQLQKRVGRDKVQFVVAGIPRHGQSAEQLERIGIPTHTFNLGRATALTSVYLMALYGYEQWLEGSYGESIFLNRKLIEEKGLDVHKINRQVADFLMDFDGVQAAYPRADALLVPAVTTGLAKAYIGDVVVSLLPGWRMAGDEDKEVDHVMDSQPDAPLYWLRYDEAVSLPMPLAGVDFVHLLLR